MYFKRFVLFFKHWDSSLVNTKLRVFQGNIPLSLDMNAIFFKQIGRLRAKFLASNFLALDEL